MRENTQCSWNDCGGTNALDTSQDIDSDLILREAATQREDRETRDSEQKDELATVEISEATEKEKETALEVST
jgi:hypothetical protein